MDHEIVLLLSS